MFFFLKIKKYFGYFSQKSINFAKNTGELINFPDFYVFLPRLPQIYWFYRHIFYIPATLWRKVPQR
jgi:hypothetical protein